MLPLLLDYFEEHGFAQTAASFRAEAHVRSRPKLLELLEEYRANGAAKRKREPSEGE